MVKISICIIARDAQETLEACIKSIAALTDNVVVVIDPRTRDQTESIAGHLGARTFKRNFDNFSNQKNFADYNTLYDWVLSLDADEEISPDLANEIKTALVKPKFDAFSIPRLNYIFGKPIYHTNWGPKDDTHIWLYRKSKSTWQEVVHEHVKVNGKIGKLDNYKIHHSYKTVEEFLEKSNRYTTLEALPDKFNWAKVITRPLGLRFILQPPWKFFRHYILFLGFLDGWHGLFLSYLMAIYAFETNVKEWQRRITPSY